MYPSCVINTAREYQELKVGRVVLYPGLVRIRAITGIRQIETRRASRTGVVCTSHENLGIVARLMQGQYTRDKIEDSVNVN